jgi:hypothetical protein
MSKRPPSKDTKIIDRNNFNLPNMNIKKNILPLKKQNLNTENSSNKKADEIMLDKLEYIPPIKKDEKIDKADKKNYKDADKVKDKKIFRFQNMSKLIVNKIDDILGCYSNPGQASSSISKYSDTLGLSKNILNNIEMNLLMAEENELKSNALMGIYKYKNDEKDKDKEKDNKNYINSLPLSANSNRRKLPSAKSTSNTSNLKEININNNNNNKNKKINNKKDFKEDKINSNKNNKENENNEDNYNDTKTKMAVNMIINQVKRDEEKEKKLKKKNKEKNKVDKKKMIREINKDVFMTKIDIEGKNKNSSSSSELEVKKLQEEEDLFDSSDEDLKGNPELQKDMNDFRIMMEEIESLKQGNKYEFDELQYLIKYVEGTNTRINRHMNGVSNLFKESGIKPKGKIGLEKLSEISDSDEGHYRKGESSLYDKDKNMGKIKDNLINLQDNFICYYKNFHNEMKDIEGKNTKYKNMLLYEKGENETGKL